MIAAGKAGATSNDDSALPWGENPAPPEIALDLRGVRCPHVVLRAKKGLRDVSLGGVLVLECTDPMTLTDIPRFVSQTGQAMEAQLQHGPLLLFRIRKRK
jgi:tRNA 2-thiouridine synthesizing protein A